MATLKMTLDLNALNHLGINLYSNVPAVLAEVVANAWDADATRVDVTLNKTNDEIVIQDNGHGMTLDDLNDKYLTVGYERREHGEAKSKKLSRPVMGRKGIGKLSLFSVATEIQVETVVTNEGYQAFLMELSAIKDAMKKQQQAYEPTIIGTDNIDFNEGTRITIRGLKKSLTVHTDKGLRKRLARRFSILGSAHDFEVHINGEEVTVEDREYFHKIQYLWTLGQENIYPKQSEKAEYHEHIETDSYSGWIGTVKESANLKDNNGESLNKIVVMMRGKLAHEDILESLGERGVYASYIIGEIHADFLDDDDQEDIATTSRQSINETAERFQDLKESVQQNLKIIQNKWTNLRNEGGVKEALNDPAIKEWYDQLNSGVREQAEKLFGKINRIFSKDDTSRKELFKYGILAIESLRVRENVDALEKIDIENLVEFGKIFELADAWEASLYHQIVRQRLSVVKKLTEQVENNVLEKVIQEHIFNHLWLLDPSWERATAGTEYMEQNVSREFGQLNTNLTSEEKNGRVDIKYRTAAGKHIIVELKRASVKTSALELMGQVEKYQLALRKLLDVQGKNNEAIEIVCIIGTELKDYLQPNGVEGATKKLHSMNARVKTYQELIQNAHQEYSDYLDKSEEVGKLSALLERIGGDIVESEQSAEDETSYKADTKPSSEDSNDNE